MGPIINIDSFYSLLYTDFPNLYPANANYWIKLISPEKTRLVIQFSKIDLEEQNDCLYDFISIEDDESYESNLETIISPSSSLTMLNSNEISHFASDEYVNDDGERYTHVRRRKRSGSSNTQTTPNPKRLISEPSFLPYVRWCGTHESNMTRFDFISATNMVLINFHSDYSVSGSGFALTWHAVPLNGCPTQTYTSIEDLNSISSPNYPNVLLNNLDCVYFIYAAAGKRIWLEFHSFDLIRDSHLEIDLGNGPFVPFQKPRQLNDGVFVSYQNRITVRLTTGFKPKGSGFHLTYKTCKCSFFSLAHISVFTFSLYRHHLHSCQGKIDQTNTHTQCNWWAAARWGGEANVETRALGFFCLKIIKFARSFSSLLLCSFRFGSQMVKWNIAALCCWTNPMAS